ncbi:MAG: GNAT family N-acetyltransferase [Candidatus Moranbacteria bacterium]|nr:GNAT family N-acetyltransferase [Candidatus Moranbacteria bacterium]
MNEKKPENFPVPVPVPENPRGTPLKKDHEGEESKFQIHKLSSISELEELSDQLDFLVTYMKSFGNPPYSEKFQAEDISEWFRKDYKEGNILTIRNEDDKIMGLAAGKMEDGVYWLEELAVNPEKQRQGAGKELMTQIIKIAKQKNAKAIELKTNVDNENAITLYESLGFESTGEKILTSSLRSNGKMEVDEREFYRFKIDQDYQPEKQLRSVHLMSPGGNPTALVLDQFDQLEKSKRKKAYQKTNDALMKELGESRVEQVGFLIPPENKEALVCLRMAGGEFCGNALRSAVELMTKKQPGQGKIEVLLVEDNKEKRKVLNYEVFKDGQIEVEMLLPEDLKKVYSTAQDNEDKSIMYEKIVLDGIEHVIIKDETISEGILEKDEETKYREKADSILNDNGLKESSPAAGVLFVKKNESGQTIMQPFVYVREIKTFFYESACGSGTTALALSEAKDKQNTTNLDVVQPTRATITCTIKKEGGQISGVNVKGFVEEKDKISHEELKNISKEVYENK